MPENTKQYIFYSSLSNLPASAHGLVVARLWENDKKPIYYMALNDAALAQIKSEVAFFAPDAPIITFPAWDVMPYDRISPKTALMAERIKALSLLSEQSEARSGGQISSIGGVGPRPYILLSTISAATQRIAPPEAFAGVAITIRKGERIKPEALISALTAQGYVRVSKTMEPGEFSVRGSLIDVMPAESTEGYRLDWFGDEVESIRRFDPMTQITSGHAESFTLAPTSEVLLSEATITRFRTRYRELFGAPGKDDTMYEFISQGAAHPGMEHFLPLFYERTTTLFDAAAGSTLLLDEECITAFEERHETILDYYEARKKSGAGFKPIPPESAFLKPDEWQQAVATATHLTTFSGAGDAQDLGYRKILPMTQGSADSTPFDQLRERMGSGKRTIIACISLGSQSRLHTLLMERGFHALMMDSWKDALSIKGKTVGLIHLPIDGGFETPEFQLYAEADLLGERVSRTARKKKSTAAFFTEAASWSEGDLLVHREHGIGRFSGLTTVTVNGASHDCIKLIYEGDDKLFLPVENIELLTRYGLEEEGKLDKLGGASWQARKARLKERITMAAEALLKTAAERALHHADIIEKPVGVYDEFIARFGYVETDDQARAIEEVLADLASGKPMDRLICGDVGFGKTEVALRAAFVCANPVARNSASTGSHAPIPTDPALPLRDPQDSKQVALICPTTLLARQHYKNFKARFAGFPVEVRQLSRMVPAKQQKQTIADLKEGKVDIVVGTHALLAKGVEFKNLGLLIVDEEQHFGVAQKEKLKSLKSDIHVLTLSATPIPRTLQMSLAGVRELSLITTPPVDRLAIRSFVTPFDPVTVREAVMRELHRGGQCFIVTPRVRDIAELKIKLAELVPEAKLCVAHGQMAAGALDEVMNDFYDGKYNVLLSTAIIESGLDIPTANTMIVHNAHLFGLSQLYQMRGRVGRGKIRAYAYFMLPHKRDLTDNATRRLEIMQTLDTLGAGFTLSNHDMDIRGFGNLVGEEQSGHIKEVGVELYQQMLEEAIKSCGTPKVGAQDPAQPLRVSQDLSPTINLGLSVLIPEHYVSDLSLRMGLYRRASALATDEDIDQFAAELVDRFGPMPEETTTLIGTLSLKLLCKKAGIDRIDVGPKGAVISFFENKFAKPEALIAMVNRRVSTLKIRPDQKLFYMQEWKSDAEKIPALKKLAGEIAELSDYKSP